MTDVRRSSRNAINATNIANIPISSDTPQNNDTLVYNATSQYYELKDVAQLTGNRTFTGDITTTGTFRVGTPSVVLNEFRHGIIDTGVVGMAVVQVEEGTFNFLPPFAQAPSMQLMAYSDVGTDAAITVTLDPNISANSFTWRIVNENNAVSTGRVFVHWMAYW